MSSQYRMEYHHQKSIGAIDNGSFVYSSMLLPRDRMMEEAENERV